MSKVFISYSHADSGYLSGLKRHLRSLEGTIEFWDDSKIAAGMKWREEIEKALATARVAVLLISADFFNSKFIMNNELPVLLKSAEANGLVILSVILKPCLFELHPQISRFQALNSPSYTLSQMSEAEKEMVWVKLLLRINELIGAK